MTGGCCQSVQHIKARKSNGRMSLLHFQASPESTTPSCILLIGVQHHVVIGQRYAQLLHKHRPVLLVSVDRPPVVAETRNMVITRGIKKRKGTRHVRLLQPAASK